MAHKFQALATILLYTRLRSYWSLTEQKASAKLSDQIIVVRVRNINLKK
jgi:hypothetical protein